MRKLWTASVAAMAFTFMAAPASAQQPWSVSGEITNEDAGGTAEIGDDEVGVAVTVEIPRREGAPHDGRGEVAAFARG
mgnify:CR=1 FL=1